MPETYSKAEGYAFQIECENMNSMSKKIDSINNLVQKDGTMDVLLNEVAPRPHNTGHYTQDACAVSQFENHLRAVSGLPLGSTSMSVAAAASKFCQFYKHSSKYHSCQ